MLARFYVCCEALQRDEGVDGDGSVGGARVLGQEPVDVRITLRVTDISLSCII
jgi:hypothetical protein